VKAGKIRIIHNMARSGGTLLCKCIGCMDNISLLSEIHPFAMQMFNPLKQAKEWFEVFPDDDIKNIAARTYIGFKEAIQIINRKCIDKGLTLVLRDWSHLDFTGLPFLKSPSYELLTAKVLKHDFEIINFCTVRHPIDQWLSFKNLGIMKEHLDLQAYLTGYRKFAEKCHEIGFIKYEDITRDPETGIKSLCEKLEIDYDPAFVDKWWQYTTITGDTNSQRGFKKEIKFMPRRPMEDGLLEKFENNEDYKKSIEILGYS
ncbi:sulfotransferase, partial [bacterium]|nr:sulfotransferase [bacterium]